ncbi:DUF167 domain-containing protein [Agromyces sp. NPDC056379]|uniref:DUF167 domain-containing protein n=1 Tax=unclassified Agromyces TaxID=2639701 RepID=UPI0035DE50C9
MVDLTIRVKPGSRKGPLVEALDGDPAASLTVFVRERAIDGAANAGVIAALADHYGVPKSRVHILRGESSRVKRVRVDDA